MTASKDCLLDSGKTAGISAGLGLLVSAMQNTVEKHHSGAKGVFTRTGGTIAIFAAMGGIFTLGECVAKDIRKEDDALNAAIGGCAAGFLAGVRTHSFGKMALGCAAIGGSMYAFESTGGLKGQFADKNRQEKKEYEKAFFKET
ncbi:hypothetical protein G6F70_007590 [Rhizopus microsporus]|uniref:Uncharacterized protein n=2 Tax=Rhizopus TaxID=4842 RepID=A0A367K605_RHIAZ|nr:hypothetical protein G6F71_006568 [Rhizopus microsporus]RCH97607.1 hypothetical protein CU097_014176 [Rhizopus azygosporus]KAG1196260.1 hypothetical protein G6F70_007590 [Rhizopus microsporus]KAG1208047.1 hypothetical protein G6F69_007549 [Rhizopus microsporus]KAG1230295.1 hypothetical protein G6F67_006560 [Rhizopus microsporus]